MRLTTKLTSLMGALSLAVLVGCGAAKDKANEVSNDINLPGHWLMTESEHSSDVTKAIENESMVLTFKNDQAAFSPVDSLKGRAVYALLSKCTVGPRPYKTEKNDIVFPATPDCGEKRVTVQKLEGDRLKFPDPEDTNTTRTFVRINEEKYQALVKADDRKP